MLFFLCFSLQILMSFPYVTIVENLHNMHVMSISFPEHARSRVSGGHGSGETE